MDLAADLLKSIRPMVVAVGDTMSSSQPLREMRSELQQQIRELVFEHGPNFFPGVTNYVVLEAGVPPSYSSAFNS
jgi:hypothetical protein